MRRMKAHPLYVEPTREDILLRFNELKFDKPFSFDLVRDIANAISYVQEGEEVTNSIIDIKDNVNPSDYKTRKGYNSAILYHENVQKFICSLDFSIFSGNTPLAKAASIVAALSTQPGGIGNEEPNLIPIFKDNFEPQFYKAKRLENSVSKMIEANKSLAKYIINPDDMTPEVALSNLNQNQKAIVENLAILQSRGKIKSNKQAAFQKTSQMIEYSQVSNLIGLSQLMIPTFEYKFATKQLIVKDNNQSAKQSLFLLIDNSGSMNETKKISWVKTIIINRLDAVARGEAELYIGWFEYSLNIENIVKITNREEAIEFINKKFYGNFNGDSTNIEKTVRIACQSIKDGKLGKHTLKAVKPQIVVVNDGQDKVDPNYKPDIITHGFILGQDNKGMMSMIKNCGGHYERFL